MFNWFQRSSKSTRSPRRPVPSVVPVIAPVVAPLDPAALARLPASARHLSPDAQRILASLPLNIELECTCRQYPQAIEKLLKHWRNPFEFRSVHDSLVIDGRGGRQGFPFDIVTELGALREFYDSYVSPIRSSAWGSGRPR